MWQYLDLEIRLTRLFYLQGYTANARPKLPHAPEVKKLKRSSLRNIVHNTHISSLKCMFSLIFGTQKTFAPSPYWKFLNCAQGTKENVKSLLTLQIEDIHSINIISTNLINNYWVTQCVQSHLRTWCKHIIYPVYTVYMSWV